MFHRSEVPPLLDKNIIEPQKLKVSPELKDRLAEFNVTFSTEMYDNLANLVTGEVALFEYKPFRAHQSTPEEPHLIFEHGASTCSLLMAIDKSGKLVTLHEPLAYRKVEKLDEVFNLVGFTEKIAMLDENYLLFLTATGANTPMNIRQDLVMQLEKLFNRKVQYLFLDDGEPTILEKRISRLKQLVKNTFSGLVAENNQLQYISELFIVPAAISKTGQTEVVIPYPNPDMLPQKNKFVQMKDFLNSLKKRFQAEA